MATKSILKTISISDKEQAKKFIEAIESSMNKEYPECPECGCKDGNHAQECTLYYNNGYGKRK